MAAAADIQLRVQQGLLKKIKNNYANPKSIFISYFKPKYKNDETIFQTSKEDSPSDSTLQVLCLYRLILTTSFTCFDLKLSGKFNKIASNRF